MAERYLSLFGPCITYSALLNLNAMASAKYHAATSELVSLAATGAPVRFAEAKRNCKTCLRTCKRTTAAMRAHKAAHGC